MRANFFCTNFLNTPRGPGHPGKIPGTSQIPLFETQGRRTFEGEHGLFDPHPFTWKTPTPPGGLRTQKVNLCALSSCLTSWAGPWPLVDSLPKPAFVGHPRMEQAPRPTPAHMEDAHPTVPDDLQTQKVHLSYCLTFQKYHVNVAQPFLQTFRRSLSFLLSWNNHSLLSCNMRSHKRTTTDTIKIIIRQTVLHVTDTRSIQHSFSM